MLMLSREVGQIRHEEEIIEELDRASYMRLLVYDDIAAACLAVPSKCGCIRGIAVGVSLQIP